MMISVYVASIQLITKVVTGIRFFDTTVVKSTRRYDVSLLETYEDACTKRSPVRVR